MDDLAAIQLFEHRNRRDLKLIDTLSTVIDVRARRPICEQGEALLSTWPEIEGAIDAAVYDRLAELRAVLPLTTSCDGWSIASNSKETVR